MLASLEVFAKSAKHSNNTGMKVFLGLVFV